MRGIVWSEETKPLMPESDRFHDIKISSTEVKAYTDHFKIPKQIKNMMWGGEEAFQ